MRVAVFSADPPLLQWAARHLRETGVAEVYACSSTRELPFLAERSDVLIALTEGAQLTVLADALRSIERLAARPALLVLGDDAIPWTPRPSSKSLVILARLAFLEWPRAASAEEDSYPELPFTD